MKKLVKQGAKLVHIFIDLLADEIAGRKRPKEKKKSNGKSKNINSSGNGISNRTDKHIYKKSK